MVFPFSGREGGVKIGQILTSQDQITYRWYGTTCLFILYFINLSTCVNSITVSRLAADRDPCFCPSLMLDRVDALLVQVGRDSRAAILEAVLVPTDW